MIRSLSFLLSGALFTAYAQTSCDALKSSLSFPDATITAIESIAAGPASAPAGRGAAAAAAPAAAAGRGGRGAAPAAPVNVLPAYCRVALTLKPSADSDIKMEAVAACRELERQIPDGRQRRLGRLHHLRGDASGSPGRLRHRLHRHRPHGRRRRSSRWGIRKSWSTSRIAPCMRRW